MSIWMRHGEALAEKSAPPGGFSMGYGGGPWFSDGARFRRAPTPNDLIEQFKSLVYSCCWINANAVGRVPLRLYAVTKHAQQKVKWWNYPKQIKRATKARIKSLPYLAKAVAGADEIEEITSHPLLDAVQWVSEDMDTNQLIQYTCICLDLFGQGYWWPFLGKNRLPVEIWPLPTQYVWPVIEAGAMAPSRYQFGGVQYEKGELLKFKRIAPRNPYGVGMGPGQASIEYTRLEDVFVSLQDAMLSNGPRPSILVSHKDPKGSFGEAERKRLENDMERRGRGGRAGGVFVVDGAAAISTLSYQPTDIGGLQVADYNMERTCNDFDVPPTFFSKDTNLANLQTATEHHARNAVEPRCKSIASTLTRYVHSLPGDRGMDRLVLAFDPAVAADRKAEADNNKTYIDMGVFTINEVRLELGYEPVEGGDEPLVSGTLKTLDAVINPPAPAPAPDAAKPGESPADDGAETDQANETNNPDADETEPEDDAADKALRARVKRLMVRMKGQMGAAP
jgi:HK97 family phage portal protein